MSPDEFTAPASDDARTVEYASFGRRLGAALLDSLVLIIGLTWLLGPGLLGISVLIISLSIYFQLCEKRWGQTIGKNAAGIRVVPISGGKLTWNATGLRNLLRLVDLPLAMVGADYLIVRNSPRRQRLGDRAAKTIVVREPAPVEERPVAQPAMVGGHPAEPHDEGSAAPTSAEIFGDAAEAMGRQPAAGSAPTGDRGEPIEESAEPDEPRSRTSFAVTAGITWGPGAALAGIFVALLAAIIFSIPVAIADPNVGQDEGSVAANLIAQLIQVAMLIAVPLAIARRGHRSLGDTLRSLGVRRFAPSAFGWMALAVVVYLVVGGLLYLLIQPEQEDIAQNFGPTSVQVLLIVIAAPISEEISFRGFLFGGLRARTPALVAALISGGLFGALHAPTGIAAVPQLVAFGAILALLYDRTGSIVPGLLLHALNNSAALLAS